MTTPPDWALSIPGAPVHTEPPRVGNWDALSQDQLRALRENLLRSFVAVIVDALTGLLIPGPLEDMINQLIGWVETLPIIGPLVRAITGITGGTMDDIIDWFVGFLDGSNGGILTQLVEAFTGLGGGLDEITDWVTHLPLISELVEILTGVEDGDLNDIGTWVNNLFPKFINQIGSTLLTAINAVFSWIIGTFFEPFGITWPSQLVDFFNGLFPSFTNGFDGTLASVGDSIQDLADGTWEFVNNGVNAMVNTVDGMVMGTNDVLANALPGLGTVFSANQELWRGILSASDINKDGAIDLDDVVAALRNLPSGNVLGEAGAADLTQTWQTFWDSLWTGLNLDGLFGTGKSPSDVQNAAERAATLIREHEITLGIRDNQPVGMTLDSDGVAPFPITDVTTAQVESGTGWGAWVFLRCPQKTVFGKVSWVGWGTTGVTGIYLDIYRMARYAGDGDASAAAGDFVWQFASGNIIAEVSDGLTYETWDFDSLPVEAGDVIAVRFVQTGNGAYQICTSAINDVVPVSANSQLPAMGAWDTASPPAALVTRAMLNAATTYYWWNRQVWFCVATGDAGYQTPVLTEFTNNGSFTIPAWATQIDYAILGGGGGGRNGDTWLGFGGGGAGGGWATGTLVRGTDFHTTATSMSVTIGGGGAGGQQQQFTGQDGFAGGGTVVAFTNPSNGTSNVTGAAGAGGTGNYPGPDPWNFGRSPGNVSTMGRTFYGGAEQTATSGGGVFAGGGGAGGGLVMGQYPPGGNGAAGLAWLQARQ